MRRKYFTVISTLIVYGSWMFGKNTMALDDICRTLEFTSPIDGKALVNHVIKKIPVRSPDACQVACYLDNHCLSYNCGGLHDGSYTCELSDSDHKQHPNDLQQRQGFIYRGTEEQKIPVVTTGISVKRNQCSSNPCSSNGKCVIDVTDNKYRCHCFQGYYGDHCEKGEWKKISDVPECFGARDNSYAMFTIKENGFIDTFKLVHKHGVLHCSPNNPPSFWGCDNPRHSDKKNLMTLITFSNNTVLPIAEYSKEIGPQGELCRYYAYQINGTYTNSKELVFDHLYSPLWVTIGQEFRIWYVQDFTDCSEENNSGQTCADVYAWYI